MLKFRKIGLTILDIWSEYSFHFLFFFIMLFSIFWSVNFSMLLYIVFFAIHYCYLHLSYFGCQSAITQKTLHYDEQDLIIECENRRQKAQAISQRTASLRFLIIYTSATLFICLLFKLTQTFYM